MQYLNFLLGIDFKLLLNISLRIRNYITFEQISEECECPLGTYPNLNTIGGQNEAGYKCKIQYDEESGNLSLISSGINYVLNSSNLISLKNEPCESNQSFNLDSKRAISFDDRKYFKRIREEFCKDRDNFLEKNCPVNQFLIRERNEKTNKSILCKFCTDATKKEIEANNSDYKPDYILKCIPKQSPICTCGLGYFPTHPDGTCFDLFHQNGAYLGLVRNESVAPIEKKPSCEPCYWGYEKPHDPEYVVKSHNEGVNRTLLFMYFYCNMPPMCGPCPAGSYMSHPCVYGLKMIKCELCTVALEEKSLTVTEYIDKCIPKTTTTTRTTSRPQTLAVEYIGETSTTIKPIQNGGFILVCSFLVPFLLLGKSSIHSCYR